MRPTIESSENSRALSVAHICEYDGGGGAMMAAYRLHSTIGALGVNSRMIVGEKRGSDPSVIEVTPSIWPSAVMHRISAFFHHANHVRRYRHTQSSTLEVFTRAVGRLGKDVALQLPNADVYHLHWTHQLVDHRHLFRRIGRHTPLVWRLADMNAFTGGCHYTLGCSKYETECNACPQLGATSQRDASNFGFRAKEYAYGLLNPRLVRIVGPSRWLMGEAASSPLLGRFQAVHIATGVDCETFSPGDAAEARNRLGLPMDRPIVLFVSDAIENHRKGFDLLVSAMRRLPRPGDVALVAVGKRFRQEALPENCRHLGHLDDPKELAVAYRAASVFVHPARSDNLPNVILEAMACGTPCVAFDVGGVGGPVKHLETGWLAAAEDVDGLARGIDALVSDEATRASMGIRCRTLIETEFEVYAQAGKYKSLYEELHDVALHVRSESSF